MRLDRGSPALDERGNFSEHKIPREKGGPHLWHRQLVLQNEILRSCIMHESHLQLLPAVALVPWYRLRLEDSGLRPWLLPIALRFTASSSVPCPVRYEHGFAASLAGLHCFGLSMPVTPRMLQLILLASLAQDLLPPLMLNLFFKIFH